MMTQERLLNYIPMKREERQLRERLTEIETPVFNPDSQQLTGMPHAPSSPGGGSKQEKQADRTRALRTWYRDQIENIHEEQVSIELAINTLENVNHRRLLRHKYIEGLTWPEVCDVMGYKKSRMHEMHDEAIELLKKAK